LSGPLQVVLGGCRQVGPHAAGATAERSQAAHHGNGDQRDNKAVFNGSRTALVPAQSMPVCSDSEHATLLWSGPRGGFTGETIKN
jgi:hypothetical protein